MNKTTLLLAGAAACVALGAAGGIVLAPAVRAANAAGAAAQVAQHALPNAPGQSLTAILVSYPPGGSTPIHFHAGSVLAYIVSGEIESQVTGQAQPQVYRAGQSFFEPPGSEHLVSANASKTKPASLLAIFVAPTGAKLTTMGPRPGAQAK